MDGQQRLEQTGMATGGVATGQQPTEACHWKRSVRLAVLRELAVSRESTLLIITDTNTPCTIKTNTLDESTIRCALRNVNMRWISGDNRKRCDNGAAVANQTIAQLPL